MGCLARVNPGAPRSSLRKETMKRPQLSYANVASTLALVLAASGGGIAYAAIAKNQVNSKSILNGSVAVKDLNKAAVPKVVEGPMTNTGTLTGTLNPVTSVSFVASGQGLRTGARGRPSGQTSPEPTSRRGSSKMPRTSRRTTGTRVTSTVPMTSTRAWWGAPRSPRDLTSTAGAPSSPLSTSATTSARSSSSRSSRRARRLPRHRSVPCPTDQVKRRWLPPTRGGHLCSLLHGPSTSCILISRQMKSQ